MRRSQKAIQTGGTGVKQSEKGLRRSQKAGYRPTRKNKNALRRWKQGKSIGFTWISSLKAKGLIPRSNGTKRVSPKYR